MPEGIRLAEGLVLPLDIVTQTLAILARKGSGKTYTALKFAEQLLKAQQQVIVVDPVGVCWGLRSSADGESAGLPILIFGGEHGDAEIPAGSGEQLARFLIESGQSAILDLGGFSNAEMKRFVADFAETLYQRNREPLHLILDEADMFAPQRPMEGEQRMLGAIDKIVRRGRARGLGTTLITQRPAAISKNVLTQVETLILQRLMSPQDRAAVGAWVEVHGTNEELKELTDSLPSLAVGEAWIWSPGALFQRVRIARRETFDSSATPKVGEKRRAAPTMADIDMDSLKSMFAGVMEETASNNPKALRKRVAELERQIANAGPSESEISREVDRATAPLLNKIAELEHSFREAAEVLRMILDAREHLFGFEQRLGSILHLEGYVASEAINGAAIDREVKALLERPPVPQPIPSRTKPEARRDADAGVTAPQSRILDALAEFEALGLSKMDRSHVALFADASPRSSGYANNLGALRTAGLVDYPERGFVCLTDSGRALAVPSERALNLKELQARWMQSLGSAPQSKILDALIRIHPGSVCRESLAALVGASLTSSGYANNLGRLRSLGLIDYPSRGLVAATSLLFPEGLK